MSKTKNYYWDEAEKFVDAVLLKLKNNEKETHYVKN